MDHFKLRATAFGWELLSLIIVALCGMAVSPEFQALLISHFGPTIGTAIALLITNGVTKHMRNMNVENQQGIGSLAENEEKLYI